MKESGSDITDEAIASLGVFSVVGELYSFFIVGTLVHQNTTSEQCVNSNWRAVLLHWRQFASPDSGVSKRALCE